MQVVTRHRRSLLFCQKVGWGQLLVLCPIQWLLLQVDFFYKKHGPFFSMTMRSLIWWTYCFFNPIMEITNISVHTRTSGSGASASITNNSQLYVGLKKYTFNRKDSLQGNLCQKLFFLQNIGRTCCVQKLFWTSETISLHNKFILSVFNVLFVYNFLPYTHDYLFKFCFFLVDINKVVMKKTSSLESIQLTFIIMCRSLV